MISEDELDKIPKADLHCHLEGMLYLSRLWEFSQRHQPGLYASFEEFHAAISVPKGTTPGFKAFLAKFEALRFHYGQFDVVGPFIFESVYNQVRSYIELRFSPVFFARRTLKGKAAKSRRVPYALVEEAAQIIVESIQSASVLMGSKNKIPLILTCDRTFGVEVNQPTLKLLHSAISKHIGGLDLCGDESVDASDFVKPFREWKEAGKLITIHAGEDPNAGGPRNIIEALDVFKADRIGHGVRAIEDCALVGRLADEQIPLEICPTSNVQTRAVPSEAEHPMKRLLDAGVCVTINTDDPTICGTTIDEEYAFAARLGFSKEDLLHCTLNAVRAGLLPDEDKRHLEKLFCKAPG